MKIAVRKETNGSIYIDKDLRPEINYTMPPYNFTIKEIEDIYKDCESTDFDENLNFNVQSYLNRKTKETTINRINELKFNLAKTDYQAIKFLECEMSGTEYAEIKAKRQAWRAEINALENKIKNL